MRKKIGIKVVASMLVLTVVFLMWTEDRRRFQQGISGSRQPAEL